MSDTRKRFSRHQFDDERDYRQTSKRAGGKHSHKYRNEEGFDYDLDDEEENGNIDDVRIPHRR